MSTRQISFWHAFFGIPFVCHGERGGLVDLYQARISALSLISLQITRQIESSSKIEHMRATMASDRTSQKVRTG